MSNRVVRCLLLRWGWDEMQLGYSAIIQPVKPLETKVRALYTWHYFFLLSCSEPIPKYPLKSYMPTPNSILTPLFAHPTHQHDLEPLEQPLGELQHPVGRAQSVGRHRLVGVWQNLQRQTGTSSCWRKCAEGRSFRTLPSSTRTDAMMSSGSPIRPSAGMLRLSVCQDPELHSWESVCEGKKRNRSVSNDERTVYVHPPLLRLNCTARLHLVHAVTQRALDRLMQRLPKLV